MPIREFFHLIHVVDNMDEANEWYDALFSPRCFQPKGYAELEKRWATLSMIGDFMIEVIEPSDAPEAQRAPLPKFRGRFGQHFHSLAFYVDAPDLRPFFDRLRASGVRIAKPGGGLFAEGDDVDPGTTIFTHPKDTFGQIEFVGLDELWRGHDPRFTPGWSGVWWRDEHPLGIERVSHFTTIAADLDRARTLYENGFDGRVVHEETSDDAESVFVFVGNETIVELARPTTTDSRLAADLAENGELPHALTFKVRDLDAAEHHVEKVGTRIVDRSGDTFTLDPADCFEAIYSFTDRTIPGDPRA
jgi:catechol 2,3-dioxygenase-like lactoylglutathione lyase family enzyme